MRIWQAILYLITAILCGLCALGWIPRVPGAFIAAGCFVLAFSLPVIAAL